MHGCMEKDAYTALKVAVEKNRESIIRPARVNGGEGTNCMKKYDYGRTEPRPQQPE